MSGNNNISSLELADTEASQKGLIPEYVYYVLGKVGIFITVCLGTQGVILNCINATVFLKLGVKDCVTICLFSLSVTDAAALAFNLVSGLCDLLEYLQIYLYVDNMAVYYLSLYVSSIAYDASSYTTAFISLERCLCVALPFRFKNMFTFKRAVFTVLTIYSFTFACYVPYFSTTGFAPIWDSRTNSTRIFVWYSESSLAVLAFLNIWNHLVLVSTALLIVMGSTYVMVRGLHESSKFQNRGTAQTSNATGLPEKLDPNVEEKGSNSRRNKPHQTSKETGENDKENSQKNDGKQQGSMSYKNRLVVKMVSTLATICLVCVSSRLLIIVVLRIQPEIRLGGRYNNLFLLVIIIAYLFRLINTSCNTFVYIRLNPKFKNVFLKTFGVKVIE